MADYSYNRSLVSTGWVPDTGLLSAAVKVALPTRLFNIHAHGANITLAFTDTLDAGEVSTLDTVVADQTSTNEATLLAAAAVKAAAAAKAALAPPGFGQPSRLVDVTVDKITTSPSFRPLMTQTVNVSAGSTLLLNLSASIAASLVTSTVYLRIQVDGVTVRSAGTSSPAPATPSAIALACQKTGLTEGDHIITVQWRVTAGSAHIRPVAKADAEHASLLVQEVLG